MYSTYILYSESLDKYYIGYTGDHMNIRLAQYLCNHKGFTAKAKDWNIVYVENYIEKQDAMKRETQLKSWKNRSRIEKLIINS